MIKKIILACGIAIALAVAAGLPAYAAADGNTISAADLPALCVADGGHIAVPSNSVLKIEGGTALISNDCDIDPGDNASVFIENAVIDATPVGGDFDICFPLPPPTPPPCGTNVTVHIDSSTIHEGSFLKEGIAEELFLGAPGSSGLMKVENSTLTASDEIAVTSDGTTIVENTTFVDSITVIHGGVVCHSVNNTPAVPCS